MDEVGFRELFPMPTRPSALDHLRGRSNHAALWKRRRLRLEALKEKEASVQEGRQLSQLDKRQRDSSYTPQRPGPELSP